MRKPKSVLVVYEPISRCGEQKYKLLQINIKTYDRENILLFSNGNKPTIANPYFASMYDIHIAVLNLLQQNNFVPHYWHEDGANLFDLDFFDISSPTELKRYYF